MPPPVLDAGGRPKGGRPALYCSSACRSAAHRLRTARATPALGEAVTRAQALADALLQTGRPWQAALETLTTQLRELTDGAAGQLAAAEEARAAAAATEERATTAERRAADALADRDADAAHARAETAVASELKALRDLGAEQAARTGAETARDAALAARDALGAVWGSDLGRARWRAGGW
ncbi:hypothetical protein HS041_28075 [Planomonospora sp. ID67723]|uniref:hypothetical protein n=1 Tax=Planomonospora sp. ID67723 TaxID=2738134 RepID=UPI0018C3A2E6|nr:hypothetical protein [Planomonospora sp. ID67723]MBG0831595.1 hypothetical protein [Planomonospora sp. ID67723]